MKFILPKIGYTLSNIITVSLFYFLPNIAIAKPPAYAIASAHPLATAAGMAILDSGGNAFDAAVTVSAVLAVVEPYSSGFGGGGFWLLHVAAENRQVMLDGREVAPLKAHQDMYLNAQGKVSRRSMDGALAAGIPGHPAALVHIAKKYGKLPLSTSLQAAIKIAHKGFQVDSYYQKMARFRLSALLQSADSKAIFLDKNQVPSLEKRIIQTDLANTIKLLAEQGFDGFYRGRTAQKLVASVTQHGGIWQLTDLANYQVIERLPIQFKYRDLTITSASPPSSGGIVLATILNILSHTPKHAITTHQIAESMKLAYADRAQYLGDADFITIPPHLTTLAYAKKLHQTIQPDQVIPVSTTPTQQKQSLHTTHFSILDGEGNRVAATLSINYPFGSGFTARGTGVLLNDEMDDFSAKPGTPNAYGLVGGHANKIMASKRPLSSMSPTFIENKERLAILGTPGGSRIITMVLQAILNFSEAKSVTEMVSSPRFHHQYLPDIIQFEKGAFTATEMAHLKKIGHQFKRIKGGYGNMQAIIWNKQRHIVTAASDPRGIGQASVNSQ